MMGNIEGKRRRGWPRMRWLDHISHSMYEFGQILGDSEDREALCAAVHGVAESSHY